LKSESGGDFANTNFSGTINDLISAAEFLKNNYRAPSVIVGHSLGRRGKPAGGKPIRGNQSRCHHRRACCTTRHKPFAKQNCGKKEAGFGKDKYQRQTVFDQKTICRRFGRAKSFKRRPRDARQAFLFLHSPQDRIVSIDNAAELFRAAFKPKGFVLLDEAEHLLSNKADALYVGDLIASWAVRVRSIINRVQIVIEIIGER
jgi:putative redox protein